MKKYKSFYYAVKEKDPAVITDLREWMHRCAFDEVHYGTIGAAFPKSKTEAFLAANKRRNDEAIEIGKRIMRFNSLELSWYRDRFEQNDMEWLADLVENYSVHGLIRIDREIDRSIAKINGTAFETVDKPELKKKLTDRYFVPLDDRPRLALMCMKLLAPKPLQDIDVGASSVTEPMKKNYEHFRKWYNRAMYLKLMPTDPVFDYYDIELDRRAYTEIVSAMSYCIVQYLKDLSANSIYSIWKWVGKMA